MKRKNMDIREYPIELIRYFAYRPWDGVSIQEAILADKTGIVGRAYDCSGGMHALEFRQDGKPAKTHPRKVFKIALYFGIRNPFILAGTLLHDTIEDVHKAILELISMGYPPSVYIIVRNVSKTEDMTDEEHFGLIIMHYDSIVVKLCDRLHNIRNMAKNLYLQKKFSKKRLRKYIAETIKFVYPLGDKISNSGHEYAKESEQIYLAIQEAVYYSHEVLKVPKKVILRYQRKRKQHSLIK